MNDQELLTRLRALVIEDPEAERRSAAAVRQALGSGPKPWANARLRRAAAGLGLIVALALTPAGASVADGARHLLGFETTPPQVEQAIDAKREIDQYLNQLYTDAIAKAKAGELQADVSPARVEPVLSAAMDPPAGEAGSRLEAQVIALLEELRAAGDIPPIGAAGRAGIGVLSPAGTDGSP